MLSNVGVTLLAGGQELLLLVMLFLLFGIPYAFIRLIRTLASDDDGADAEPESDTPAGE